MRSLRTWIQILVALVGLCGGGLAWVARAQIQTELQPITARVIVLETRREDESRRLERIESKLDRLLENRREP